MSYRTRLSDMACGIKSQVARWEQLGWLYLFITLDRLHTTKPNSGWPIAAPTRPGYPADVACLNLSSVKVVCLLLIGYADASGIHQY